MMLDALFWIAFIVSGTAWTWFCRRAAAPARGPFGVGSMIDLAFDFIIVLVVTLFAWLIYLTVKTYA